MRLSVIITTHRQLFFSLPCVYYRGVENIVDPEISFERRLKIPPTFRVSPVKFPCSAEKRVMEKERERERGVFRATLIGRALILMYAVPPRGFSGPVQSRKGAEERKESAEEKKRERRRRGKQTGEGSPLSCAAGTLSSPVANSLLSTGSSPPFPFAATHIYI